MPELRPLDLASSAQAPSVYPRVALGPGSRSAAISVRAREARRPDLAAPIDRRDRVHHVAGITAAFPERAKEEEHNVQKAVLPDFLHRR